MGYIWQLFYRRLSKRMFKLTGQYFIWHSFKFICRGQNEIAKYHCHKHCNPIHCSDVIMSTAASQITSLTIVCSTVYSDAYQRKHQSSASLAFVLGIHREPSNSPHKRPVTRKMFPFEDVIMLPWVMPMCHSTPLPRSGTRYQVPFLRTWFNFNSIVDL